MPFRDLVHRVPRQVGPLRLFKLALVCSCLVSASLANAQQLGDAGRGLAYAQRHCSGCHAVQAGQLASPLPAATFNQIANTPGMTRMALTVWFQSPHPNMPNLILEPGARDDVIAYIVSLRDMK